MSRRLPSELKEYGTLSIPISRLTGIRSSKFGKREQELAPSEAEPKGKADAGTTRSEWVCP